MKRFFELLIEPVWNRNQPSPTITAVKTIPFNRTSMESKRRRCRHIYGESRTFNRTSMESKQNYGHGHTGSRELLIEPVWNRNSVVLSIDEMDLPTFNRTSMESKLCQPRSRRSQISIF